MSRPADVAQRAHGDARAVHRNQQIGDAIRRPVAIAGSHQREHPVRPVGHRGPHLLAGHAIHVAVANRARRERRKVASRTRFGESLAPELVGAQQGLEEAILLLLRTVRYQGGRQDE